MFELLDTSGFKELEYPEELKGSWMYYIFFEDKRPIDGVCLVYFNDTHPSGSIYVGDYILNDYPDVYATWKKRDESGDIFTDKMNVSPLYRNKGIGKAALAYGSASLKLLFNKNLIHKQGTEIGNKMFESALNSDNSKHYAVQNAVEVKEELFDQPTDPYIFFGKRVVK
jgi:hypothetical protein